MKKQVFVDKEQSVVIKVFNSPEHLDREIAGVKAFKNLVRLPDIERLDSCVAKISFLPGFLGYQIREQDLTLLVAEFLSSQKSSLKDGLFTIFAEIKRLREVFKQDISKLDLLNQIERIASSTPLVPVHGDLQKQNIIIADGQLGLIDFEHFIWAPQELELCNSLFFNDGNCLQVDLILKELPVRIVNRKRLWAMLQFYALKQIALGMNESTALNRLDNVLLY